jgi:hypothetical protein
MIFVAVALLLELYFWVWSSSNLWRALNFMMQQLWLIEWLCCCSDMTG